MSKAKSWSGNDTSELSLSDDNFHKIYDFCKSHSRVYIFGKGKIGTALANYMENAEIAYAGFITSSTVDAARKEYDNQKYGIILGVGDEYYDEILPVMQKFVDEIDLLLLPQNFKFLLQYQSPLNVQDLFHLIVFTTTKCNLHCKSCSTFAPVLSPEFYAYQQFAEDIRHFKELNFERINVIKFTGGEPFLHRDLFEMFSTARALFPDTPIECYTNGSLLNTLTDEQLQRLKQLEVVPVITEYPPLESKMNDFYERANEAGLKYHVIFSENQKYFSKRPLGFEKCTPTYIYAACPRFKFSSVFLYRGKLYKCAYCMLSEDFNKAFDKDLRLEDGDFLDLYGTNKEEVFHFIISRKPFCGYCKPITELVPWGLSERKIEEWT